MYNSSKYSHSNSKNKIPSLKNIEIAIREKMNSKYSTDIHSFNKKIINDIIYNEKSHIVANFKDYLIFDDLSEFLKRYYKSGEAVMRLPKIYDYYENYSKIFPNYINLHEAKYIYKNIQKKQKMIDNQQRHELEIQNGIYHPTSNKAVNKLNKMEDKIFNTEIYDSIMNQTEFTIKDKDEFVDSKFSSAGFNIGFKPDVKKNGQILNFENSVHSIERLIDTIGEAEKNDKNEKTDKLELTPKLSKTDKFEKFKQPAITDRGHDTNKILSPIIKKNPNKITSFNTNLNHPNSKTTNEKFSNFKNSLANTQVIEKKNLKTIEVNGTTKDRLTPIPKNTPNTILNNLVISRGDLENDSNLLQQKYKDIKNKKSKLSSDFTNISSFKDKLKNEYNSTLNTINPPAVSLERKKYKTKISVITAHEKIPDSSRSKQAPTANTSAANPDKVKHNKNTSIPKLTNNIFYIINQNPQVNTQITIYNNSDINKNNSETISKYYKPEHSPTPKIHTARERDSYSTNTNSKMMFKINEKNELKKLQSFKPEILNIFNKNKEKIVSGVNNGVNNKKTNNHSCLATTPLKIIKYDELRTSTPSQTARQVNNINIILLDDPDPICL